MPEKPQRMAIFIVPRSSTAWKGAEAVWITIHGWATAAEQVLGQALVFTTDRVAKPSEILDYPLWEDESSEKSTTKERFSFIPGFLKVLVTDLLLFFKKRNSSISGKTSLRKEEIAFVWEQHDLFSGSGRRIANLFGVPLILYVHAPVIWEAEKWGTKRYAWGKLLSFMESRTLRRADCVAVVSEEVKQQVIRMGVNRQKILVSPMAVDKQLYSESITCRDIYRRKWQLDKKFVIGWTGSFRKFHGLDIVIKSFANFSVKNSEAILLLIGEGAIQDEMKVLASTLGIDEKVIFAGKYKYSEIPELISVFDIGVVGAPPGDHFHYSPLKLREYMAAGKAVLAPNVGEIPQEFESNQLRLYKAGDILSLSGGMDYLFRNKREREKIACEGRKAVLKNKTWEKELQKALRFLEKKE